MPLLQLHLLNLPLPGPPPLADPLPLVEPSLADQMPLDELTDPPLPDRRPPEELTNPRPPDPLPLPDPPLPDLP
jgi:hypothetical protein